MRAIATALDISWEESFTQLMIEAFRLSDMPSSNYVTNMFLKSKGFKRRDLPDTCPECYRVKDFCKDHKGNTYIVGTGSHLLAVLPPGNYHDNWDSGDEIVMYYFEKEEKKDG